MTQKNRTSIIILKPLFQGFFEDQYQGLNFSISTKDLFCFITIASVYNFANYDILSAFPKTISEFKNALERESLSTADWLDANKMIFIADNFQGVIIDKKDKNIQTVNY